MEELKMLALAPLNELEFIYRKLLVRDQDPGSPETFEDILDVFEGKINPREKIIKQSGGNYTFGSSNEELKSDLENSGWVRGEFGENREKFDAILDEYISEMTDDDIISVFKRAYEAAQESKKESDAFRSAKRERIAAKKKADEIPSKLRKFKFIYNSLNDDKKKDFEKLTGYNPNNPDSEFDVTSFDDIYSKIVKYYLDRDEEDRRGPWKKGMGDRLEREKLYYPSAIDFLLKQKGQNESTKLKGKVFNEYVEIILNENDELDEYVEETVCEKCGGKVDKEMVSEEAGDEKTLFEVIDDLAGALEEYYIYSEEQAEDPEEFEDIGEAIGVIRKSFAMFQANVGDADKIIQAIISKSKGLE